MTRHLHRAPYATPILLVNEFLLIAWAVNLALPGLYSKAGYQPLAAFASQRVWLYFIVGLALGFAAAMFWPKLLICLLPTCAAFWAAAALAFFHASRHGLGWELVVAFDALLIREYLTAGWLGGRFANRVR